VPLYRPVHDVLAQASQPAVVVRPTMPLVMTNMISGGAHANRNLDIQDVLIVPKAEGYAKQLEIIVRVYRRLGLLLREKGYEGYLVGDEGGYGPRLRSNREAIELVLQAIERAGLAPGNDVSIALDVAATQFFRDGRYELALDRQSLDASGMIDLLCEWARDYPICSIEDGLADEDWPAWQGLTLRLKGKTALVGDDLFTTNPERLQRGIEGQVATSVLVKMNQIGTLSETFETMILAGRNGYGCVVSARSGESEDDTMADLAVAGAAAFIKIGSIVRSERLAKYNRLLRIVDELAAGR
jgi:enolase